MKPILVLCLGNEVLSDDAFGFYLHRRLVRTVESDSWVEVIYSSIAGFSLLDLLHNRSRVLVVDAIKTGQAAGTLHFFSAGNLTPSRSLTGSHQISLPTALKLGREMGLDLPTAVDVLAVEVQDVETLSEQLTAEVEAALEPACRIALQWIHYARKELDFYVARKEDALAV